MGKGADIPPCVTADGAFVKRGDIVWSIRHGACPRRKVVTRDTLKVWSLWRLHETHFADESLALVAGKAKTEKALTKAKSTVRSETRTLATIMARLTTTANRRGGE